MISEQQRDLIQRAVDGELDEAERAELTQLFEESAEARELHDELSAVDSLLRGLPGEAPPADLHANILDAIQPPQPVTGGDPSVPALFRYGLAASVGLMIAVAFYESGPQIAGPDVDDMIGTMAPRTNGEPTVEVIAIGATASLSGNGATRTLEIAWNSPDDVEIAVDLAGSGLGFDAVARLEGQPDSLQVVGNALRFRGRGKHRVVARLTNNEGDASDDAAIHIEFMRDGSPISRERLAAD